MSEKKADTSQPSIIVLKNLTEKDLKIAQDLFQWFRLDEAKPVTSFPDDEYLANLLKREDFIAVVAMDGDSVVGGATGYVLQKYYDMSKELFLYEIGVHDGYLRRGIGTDLMEFIKEWCQESGINVLYVGAETDNEPALGLYRKTLKKINERQITWFEYYFPQSR